MENDLRQISATKATLHGWSMEYRVMCIVDMQEVQADELLLQAKRWRWILWTFIPNVILAQCSERHKFLPMSCCASLT